MENIAIKNLGVSINDYVILEVGFIHDQKRPMHWTNWQKWCG